MSAPHSREESGRASFAHRCCRKRQSNISPCRAPHGPCALGSLARQPLRRRDAQVLRDRHGDAGGHVSQQRRALKELFAHFGVVAEALNDPVERSHLGSTSRVPMSVRTASRSPTSTSGAVTPGDRLGLGNSADWAMASAAGEGWTRSASVTRASAEAPRPPRLAHLPPRHVDGAHSARAAQGFRQSPAGGGGGVVELRRHRERSLVGQGWRQIRIKIGPRQCARRFRALLSLARCVQV